MASTSQNYKKPSTSRLDQPSGSPHRSRLQDHHRAKDRWPKRHGKDGKEYSRDPSLRTSETTPDFLPTSQNNNSALKNWKQRAKSTENLLSPSHRPRRSARSGSQPDLLRGSHGETSTFARSISGRLPPYQPELLASAMFDSDEDDTESVYSLDKLRTRSRSMPSRQSSTERYRMHACHCNCANKTLVSRREVKRTTGRTPLNGIQIDDPPVPKPKGKQLVSKAGTSEVKSKSSEKKSGTKIQTTAETHEPRPNTSRESSLQEWNYMSSPRMSSKIYEPVSGSKDSASTPSTSSPIQQNMSPQRQQKLSPHRQLTSSPQRVAISPYENVSYHHSRPDSVSMHNQYTLYPQWDEAISPQWDDTLHHKKNVNRDSPPIYEKVSPHRSETAPRPETMMTYPRRDTFSPTGKPQMPRSVSSQQLPTKRREAMKYDGMQVQQPSEKSGLTELERRRREHSSESSLARLDCVHARQKQLLQQNSSSSSFTSQDDIVLERYSEEPRNRWRGDNNVLPRGQHNECRKCVSERKARRETFEAGTAVSTEIFLKEDAATGKKQFVKISTV